MPRLTVEQAKQIGRIRDALGKLGYPVPPGQPGAPGTLADLATMAPSMGKFAARGGADFVKRLRDASSPEMRAEMFIVAADAAVRAQKRTVPYGDLLKAVGEGFLAFHATKSPRARAATVLGVLKHINAATSR